MCEYNYSLQKKIETVIWFAFLSSVRYGDESNFIVDTIHFKERLSRIPIERIKFISSDDIVLIIVHGRDETYDHMYEIM